jgi:hypothetical protein
MENQPEGALEPGDMIGRDAGTSQERDESGGQAASVRPQVSRVDLGLFLITAALDPAFSPYPLLY